MKATFTRQRVHEHHLLIIADNNSLLFIYANTQQSQQTLSISLQSIPIVLVSSLIAILSCSITCSIYFVKPYIRQTNTSPKKTCTLLL
jgi:hypothetical protein